MNAVNAMTVSERIAGILADKYGYPPDVLGPQTRFTALDFDSLVLAELAALLGHAYGVALVDDELAEAGSIGEVAGLVERRAAERRRVERRLMDPGGPA
jgi:acyl carrier protein